MGSSEESRRQELGDEISALMSGLVRSFRAGFLACADQLGLGPGEAQALWLLSIGGDATTGGLARRLGVDPANASTMLTKLERRDLVKREPSPEDRRKRLATLTEKGRETRRALARCMSRRQPGFAELSTSELVAFRDLLRRIGAES